MRQLFAVAGMIALVLTGVVMAAAQGADLRAGIVCPAPVTSSRDAPGTISGRAYVMQSPPVFISDSTVVPAVRGLGFGVMAAGLDALEADYLTVVMTHPPMGAGGVTQQTFESAIAPDGVSFVVFTFDHDYELVTGAWQIAASAPDGPVYAVGFDIVPAGQTLPVAQLCSSEPALS